MLEKQSLVFDESPGNFCCVIEPPHKVKTYWYRCDSKFHLDFLYAMTEIYDTFGVILLAGEIAKLYSIDGNDYKFLYKLTNYAPSKQGRGGQSKERLERVRLEYYNDYYKRILESAKTYFIDTSTNLPNIKGLILAGPSLTKNKVLDHETFDYRLKKIVKKVITTSEIIDTTIIAVIDQISDLLSDDNDETKIIVKRFNEGITIDNGLSVYGPAIVLKCLNDNQLKHLIVHQSYIDEYKDSKDELSLICKNNGCQMYISNSNNILTYGRLCGLLWYANKDLYEHQPN